jgi:predicted nucleic acid-binding Zn ribbon protein
LSSAISRECGISLAPNLHRQRTAIRTPLLLLLLVLLLMVLAREPDKLRAGEADTYQPWSS